MRGGGRLCAAFVFACVASGCVSIPSLTNPPPGASYRNGVGVASYRQGMLVTLDAVDGALSDLNAKETFRHADRRQAVVRAKLPNGRRVEINAGSEGIVTTLSVSVGRFGNREETERVLAAIGKRVGVDENQLKTKSGDDAKSSGVAATNAGKPLDSAVGSSSVEEKTDGLIEVDSADRLPQ